MTRLQTATRQSLGWDQIVETLKNTSDLNQFHNHMLDLQCKIVAADYGAIWTPPEVPPPPAPAGELSETQQHITDTFDYIDRTTRADTYSINLLD